jgi:uncharacterized repeat protein (TIGR01451 family)
MTKSLLLAAVAAGLFLSNLATAAANAGAPEHDATLTSTVFKEVETPGPNGAVMSRKPAARVTPGDQVVYVLTYRNGGTRSADGVVVTNPLAKDLVYAGPADARPPLVSLDGQTFGPLAALSKAGAGGARVAAVAADVTAIRWTFDQPVPAGGEVQLSFRARLK